MRTLAVLVVCFTVVGSQQAPVASGFGGVGQSAQKDNTLFEGLPACSCDCCLTSRRTGADLPPASPTQWKCGTASGQDPQMLTCPSVQASTNCHVSDSLEDLREHDVPYAVFCPTLCKGTVDVPNTQCSDLSDNEQVLSIRDGQLVDPLVPTIEEAKRVADYQKWLKEQQEKDEYVPPIASEEQVSALAKLKGLKEEAKKALRSVKVAQANFRLSQALHYR
mmetsp:Transcript_21025/g.45170  ORF Transcript_21025/g.45170 Transcript_21025/m.45170 type:complete len:221 (-) Transcript_21025:83-745(-)